MTDGRTDIVCIELIDAQQGRHCCGPEGPAGDGPYEGKLALVEVVDEHGVESDVTVHDEGSAEEGVEDGVGCCGSDESRSCEWDEGCGEDAFECPVV